MKRLMTAGVLTLALAAFGADRFLADLDGARTSGSLMASNGPIISYTPRPPAPCATDMSSAKSAVAGAQGELTLDHDEARISSSQLKTLSGDLSDEAKSAEQGGDWHGVCKDISSVEAEATQE